MLIQPAQTIGCDLEAEAVTQLFQIIKATYLVFTNSGEVNTHASDYLISPLPVFELRDSLAGASFPCLCSLYHNAWPPTNGKAAVPVGSAAASETGLHASVT